MKRAMSVSLVFMMLIFSAAPIVGNQGSTTTDIQLYQPIGMNTLSADPYEDETVALSMTTVVGTGGSDYENAMNLLTASTLGIRRSDTTQALSLVIPDVAGASYETPYDEWMSFLGGSTEELLFIGDVNESAYQTTIDQAGLVERINETDFYDTASAIASQYFRNSDTVVVSYADPAPTTYSEITTLYDEGGILSPPTTTATGYSTGSSNYWEVATSRTRAGGGVIAWTTGSSSVLDWQLSQLGMYYGGKFYGLDYPWYGDHKMAYPYFEGFGDQWRFNFIDMYYYDRVASFTLYVSTLDIQTYPFTIADDEIAQIDFEVVAGNTTSPIGLYVLDPDGALILDANRFALIEDEMESDTLTATLSYPGPGTYTAYVTTPSNIGAEYTIEMTKKVFNPDLIESEIAAANGLSIASLGDSPLLYSTGGGLTPSVISALSEIDPDRIIVVDPGNRFSASTLNSLNVFAGTVDHVTGIDGVQEIISTETGLPVSSGNVTIFDPTDTFFAAAGLSAAHREGVAIPLCYQGTSFMTKSQIAEQFAWHADYTYPFIGGYHVYDYWTSSPDYSSLHPEYDLMYNVYLEFEDWLTRISSITAPESLIVIAPYNEPGDTLPPAFDRTIIGDCRVGRYPSRIAESTFCQILQSVLRTPLLSTLNDPKVIDSHVAYSHGMRVYQNSLSSSYVYASNTFPTVMASAGINCTREAGPTVPNLVGDGDATFWMLSSHGAAGEVLYRDDGRIVLMNMDCYRGYESGCTPDSPDADSDEMVNPPNEYLIDLNLTDFISGKDLHGLVAYFNTCQIGASYSPSLMLEAGAEAVMACWVDSYFGPSDLLEQNTMQGYATSNLTLSDAYVDALMINSHVYSRNYEGREIYNYHLISATSNQGIIFGNPDVRLLDYQVSPPRIVRRIESDLPTYMETTLGYSIECNVSLRDHLGYMMENDYIEYVVETPTGVQFQQGIADCPDNFTAPVDIFFPEASDPGNYTVLFSSPFSVDAYRMTVEVMLPTSMDVVAESALGGTTNVTLGLLDHLGNPMPSTRYECIIRDPSDDIFYNASILCGDGLCCELCIRFDITDEPGLYTIEFWRDGDFHTYEILVNVYDNQVIGQPVLDVSIGDSLDIGFGLIDHWGSSIDIDIFEYVLVSPSNITLASGVVDSPDGISGSVSCDFPLHSEIGVYQFYFGIPGAEVMYPVLINLHDLQLYIDAIYTETVATTCQVNVGLETFQGGTMTIDALDYALYSPSSSIVLEGSLTDVSTTEDLDIDIPIYFIQGAYTLELTIPGTSRSYSVIINVQYPTFSGPTSLSTFCGNCITLPVEFSGIQSTLDIDQIEYIVTNPAGQVFDHGFIDREGSVYSPINLEFGVYAEVGNYIVEIKPAGALFSYSCTVAVRAPNLTVAYVNAPVRPQVGVWHIDVTIRNLENVTVTAQLTVKLGSITIADSSVELNPGESVFQFSHDWVNFVILNPDNVQIEVLLNYGQLTSQSALVPMTSSWQVTTAYSIVPILVAIVPVTELYRRKTKKKLNRLTMAQELEMEGDRGLVSAFATYVDLNMPKSALRAALKRDLPDDMLHSLMAMGGNITYSLRTEAIEYEKRQDYNNAARLFGILGQRREQTRNQILAFQQEGDINSLLDLARSLLESGHAEEFVLACIQMINTGQSDDVITLLSQTQEFKELIAKTVISKPEYLSAFKEPVSKIDPGQLLYYYSLQFGMWDLVIDAVIAAKTGKSMASVSNDIDKVYRLELVTRVVSKLLEMNSTSKIVTYVKHVDLTNDEREKVIQAVGAILLSDPDNANAKKVLTGFRKLSETAEKQVDEFMMILESISTGGKGDVKDYSALLTAAGLCKSADLADNLIDQALDAKLKGGSPTTLSLSELSDLTHKIRALQYSAGTETKTSFESHLNPLERELIDRIIIQGRKAILTIGFNPESPANYEASIRNLTKALVEISSNDPHASITAYLKASKLTRFSEMETLVSMLMTSPLMQAFIARLSTDRWKMQKLANRAVRIERTSVGIRQIVDEHLLGVLIMEEAKRDWENKAQQIWKSATARAALQIANESMQMEISDEEKMEIVSSHLAPFSQIPIKESGKSLEYIFKSLVEQAKFSSEQQLEIIENSQLPEMKKRTYRAYVKEDGY